MLYKYVKSQPVILSQRPSISISPKKKSKIVLSVALTALIVGVTSLVYSVYPYASATFYNISGSEAIDKSILSSTNSDTQILGVSQSGSLSSAYVSNLYKNLASTNKQLNLFDEKNHPELAAKSGEMKITISRLSIKSMPIAINVNSYAEKDYLPILDTKLAHFKGTSLPSYPGNTFVYGHSTNELIARSNPQSPQVAFTFLNKLEIGDEISVELDGENFKYIVQRSRVVEPEDISPILTTNEKKTLTLMTCWPPGVGEKRLILVANLV